MKVFRLLNPLVSLLLCAVTCYYHSHVAVQLALCVRPCMFVTTFFNWKGNINCLPQELYSFPQLKYKFSYALCSLLPKQIMNFGDVVIQLKQEEHKIIVCN